LVGCFEPEEERPYLSPFQAYGSTRAVSRVP
jgi:hypothetical protein